MQIKSLTILAISSAMVASAAKGKGASKGAENKYSNKPESADYSASSSEYSEAPEYTTKAPEHTEAPESTTKAPEYTTEAPEYTKAPEYTTEAPVYTIAPEYGSAVDSVEASESESSSVDKVRTYAPTTPTPYESVVEEDSYVEVDVNADDSVEGVEYAADSSSSNLAIGMLSMILPAVVYFF